MLTIARFADEVPPQYNLSRRETSAESISNKIKYSKYYIDMTYPYSGKIIFHGNITHLNRKRGDVGGATILPTCLGETPAQSGESAILPVCDGATSQKKT